MAITSRLLTLADRDAMYNIITSRPTYMKTIPMTDSLIEAQAHIQKFFMGRKVVGVFEDGVLDAFLAYNTHNMTPGPRSDDYDNVARREPFCVAESIFTMRKPNRAKYPAPDDWDINMTELLNQFLTQVESEGIYTHWSFVAAAWDEWRSNPYYHKVKNYVKKEVCVLQPNEVPQDEFVRTYITKRNGPEAVRIRCLTLPDQYRT